jgi:hypothetical protein
VAVAGVQFKLDGVNLGAEDTASPYSISWDTTTAGNGSHSLTAVARDSSNNTATATNVTVTVNNDTTAPTVAMTAPANGATVSGTSVTVSATASDNVAVAGVQFKLDGANLGAEVMTSPYAIAWDTTPVANGSHTLTAVARDAAGNTATAASVTVTVVDGTPPTVSMTTPANGATVSGTSVTVSATASDNVAVAGVQFKLDGANLGAEDTVAPYSIIWDSKTAANGSHSLTAIARDAAGNTTTAAAVSVTVNNDLTPPTVSITAPAGGATVSGTNVTVSATATDNVAVAGVQFRLDGANLGAEDTASPYTIVWNSTTTANGSHALTAVARDSSGNTATATAVTVTVNNDTTPPTVSMTAPANGATVIGTVTVSATATDETAVAGVQFKLDGANFGGEDTIAPYSIAWDTTTIANGSHTLTAVARDAAGNMTTATAVTVTVNNLDSTPPTVSMTAPPNGATVAGSSVTVTATASDNIAVIGVQFLLDGLNLGAEDTTSPYTMAWNTIGVANGVHSLSAVARDGAGNTTTATPVSVTVNNDVAPPTVTMTAPANGATVTGTAVTVSATASDNFGVVGVQFLLDGAALGAEVTSAPYTYAWNSTTASNGSHTLAARARDAAGNQTTSAAVTVTVSNVAATAPVIDAIKSVNRSNNATTLVSGAFSTTAANELLLAFISGDYLGGTNTTVTGVTGAGLTWVLVKRTNVQSGTSEIWRAFASTTLTSVSVTATLSQSTAGSMTIVSFSNVDTTGTSGSGAVGASVSTSSPGGPPTATLVTTRNNSWVFGVGNDFDDAIARTVGSNQTKVNEYLATIGDTYWVQRTTTAVATTGTSVTLNDTAPNGDRYNFTICEIRAPQ